MVSILFASMMLKELYILFS